MTSRQNILQIAAGAAIGAAITAVIMWQLLGPKGESAASPPVSIEYQSDVTIPDETAEESPPDFRRDISGDCTLLGTVTDEEGAPLADVPVGIWLHDQPWSDPQPKPLAKTDPAGAFRIEKINGELPLSLWAGAEHYSAAIIPSPGCNVPQTLVLEPGGAVKFTVKNGANQPVYNAQVHLFGDGLWPPRQGRTDTDGRLKLFGLAPGEYAVLAEKNDQIFSSESLFEVVAAKTTDVAVQLTPAQRRTIAVVDATDQTPIQGAFVVTSPAPSSIIRTTAQTDAAGKVAVNCPRESCFVSAASEKYPASDPIPVKASDETVIPLTRGATVSGRVIDRQGTPVKGAEIRILEEMGSASISLSGTAEAGFRQYLSTAAAAGPPSVITSDEEGTAILGPTTLPLPEAPCENCAATSQSATDETGSFTLTGLPRRRVSVVAVHPEMVYDGSPVPAALDTGEVVSNILIVMKVGAKVTVRILDERDVPVLGAAVVVFSDDGELIRDTTSDTDGYARFVGLPFGTRIEIAKDGYIPRTFRTDARTQEDEVSITLAPADRIIHGRVKDGRGFGVGNVAVTARLTERGRLQVLTAVTEADGTFTLEGAGEGRYRITADGGEQGGAQALDMTYRDDVKLVLDTSKRSPDADLNADMDAPMIIAPPGWNGGASINDIGGEYTNAENVGADNLGMTGPKGAALAIPTPEVPSVSAPDAPESPAAQFGRSDALSVTGPPPGKGGLPIGIGGGAGKVTVTKVAVGSRVETAGLSRGARILAVNGQKVSGPADAKRALQGPIGTVVMLEVSDNPDGTDPYTIVVQRERIP